ncbi:MAG: hypothetical protein GY803_20055, partial [Chloroflexi bacterium]|nr:hypothetical protein [Chloroflexota bacterium]
PQGPIGLTGADGADGATGPQGEPGPTYSAGSGIEIAGSTITNMGDLDADNELNISVVLNGTTLEITDAGGTISVDLSGLGGGSSIQSGKLVLPAISGFGGASTVQLPVTFTAPFAAEPVVNVSLQTNSADFAADANLFILDVTATGFTAHATLSSVIKKQTVDGSGNVGSYSALLVVNGKPAISYYDATNQDLKYVQALDASGTAWGTPIDVDTADSVGSHLSMAIVNGKPAISYYDDTNNDLKYVQANDADGATWNTAVTVVSSGTSGLYTSLAVVNGNPAISYYIDGNKDNLMFVRASDADGAAWNAPIQVDTADRVGTYTSLAVVNGKPAIGYLDVTNSDLKYAQASDADGATWNTPVVVDAVGDNGLNASLAIVNGKPAISYYDYSATDLKYVQANDADGTTWSTPVTVDATDDAGEYSSLAIVDGKPAISYRDWANSQVKFVQANDADGSSWDAPMVVGPSGYAGWNGETSLFVVDGQPAISYYGGSSVGLLYASPGSATASINWMATAQ